MYLTNSEYTEHFEYTVLPSAFQAVDQVPSRLFREGLTSDWKMVVVASCFLGFVAVPITAALTPVTIVADLVVGVAEVGFCAYKGASKDVLGAVAMKKIVVAPAQQLVFLTCYVAYAALISLIHPALAIVLPWPGPYSLAQFAVSKLPDSLNHQRFNIFFRGGIWPHGPGGKIWFDEDEVEVEVEVEVTADDLMKEQRKFLSEKCTSNTSDAYNKLKQAILSADSIKEIFESFGDGPLKKKYHQALKACHPDKNFGNENEAHIVFEIVKGAYEELTR